jgi:hypothetical protein
MDGQTNRTIGMTKITVAFRNFINSSKMEEEVVVWKVYFRYGIGRLQQVTEKGGEW